MVHGKTIDHFVIDGNNLVHIKQFRGDMTDTVFEEREVVMNKWAFIMCFEKWILGERKIQLDQERRQEELEREEQERKEKLAHELEEIRKNMERENDNGKSV